MLGCEANLAVAEYHEILCRFSISTPAFIATAHKSQRPMNVLAPSSNRAPRTRRTRTRRHRPILLPPHQTHILPQRHILTLTIPQLPLNLRALTPFDPQTLRRRIHHQRPPHLQRFCIILDDDQAHGFVLGEVALDVDDAHGEETGFAGEGAVGAFVYEEGAVGREAVEEPEGMVPDWVGVREEAGM